MTNKEDIIVVCDGKERVGMSCLGIQIEKDVDELINKTSNSRN